MNTIYLPTIKLHLAVEKQAKTFTWPVDRDGDAVPAGSHKVRGMDKWTGTATHVFGCGDTPERALADAARRRMSR